MREKIKKYWGYVAAFVLGILAYLGVDRARGSRADRNLSKLEQELREYQIRIEQLESINRRLEQQAAELGGNNEELGRTIEELDAAARRGREDIQRTTEYIDEVRVGISELGDDTRGLEAIERRLQEKSQGIGEGIQRLGEFIEKYAEKTEGD